MLIWQQLLVYFSLFRGLVGAIWSSFECVWPGALGSFVEVLGLVLALIIYCM